MIFAVDAVLERAIGRLSVIDPAIIFKHTQLAG